MNVSDAYGKHIENACPRRSIDRQADISGGDANAVSLAFALDAPRNEHRFSIDIYVSQPILGIEVYDKTFHDCRCIRSSGYRESHVCKDLIYSSRCHDPALVHEDEEVSEPFDF